MGLFSGSKYDMMSENLTDEERLALIKQQQERGIASFPAPYSASSGLPTLTPEASTSVVATSTPVADATAASMEMPVGIGTETAAPAATNFAPWGMAAGLAGTAFGNALDPEGSGSGPGIAGAGSGAGTGLMVGGPVGAVIGGTIGLGLGLLQASNKRKQIQKAANIDALSLSADGLQKAAQNSPPSFTFGSSRGSFSQGRGLKF